MKVGVHISEAVGHDPSGDDYIRVARHAEGLGFHSLWLGDHIVIPKVITAAYPYTKDGSIGFPPRTPWPDPFALLAAIGASTETIRLGTGVLVVPYRNPVVVAKSVATVDRISKGRFVFGVGLGWLREEYETLGVPFKERGARTDEYLRIMKIMWAGGDSPFEGQFHSIPALHVNPLPVQKPHPPILIGGQGAPAFKRIVALGDGWLCGHIPVAAMRPQLEQLAQMMREAGRNMSDISISMICDPAFLRDDRQGVGLLETLGVTELVLYLRNIASADACLFELDSLAKAIPSS